MPEHSDADPLAAPVPQDVADEIEYVRHTLEDGAYPSGKTIAKLCDMLERLARALAEADAVIASNEGEWALRNIKTLAPWFDAAIVRHKARDTNLTDLKHDNAQLVAAASEEATRASALAAVLMKLRTMVASHGTSGLYTANVLTIIDEALSSTPASDATGRPIIPNSPEAVNAPLVRDPMASRSMGPRDRRG